MKEIDFIEEFKDLCWLRHDALYNKDDYKTANKYEAKLDKTIKKILLKDLKLLYPLLNDENDYIKYQAAGTLISVYPKECIKVLKDLNNDKASWYKVDSEYVIQNYKDGENYYQKFLKEHSHEIEK